MLHKVNACNRRETCFTVQRTTVLMMLHSIVLVANQENTITQCSKLSNVMNDNGENQIINYEWIVHVEKIILASDKCKSLLLKLHLDKCFLRCAWWINLSIVLSVNCLKVLSVNCCDTCLTISERQVHIFYSTVHLSGFMWHGTYYQLLQVPWILIVVEI